LSPGAASRKHATSSGLYHRQPARLANEKGVLDDVVALERALEKEPQCGDCLVEVRHPNATRRQIPKAVVAKAGQLALMVLSPG
jgi:hypothetical protein